MSDQADIVRVVPVYVVIPPRVLLLDVAGPLEVLRKANLEQHKLRFDVCYMGQHRPCLVPSVCQWGGWSLCQKPCQMTHWSLFRVLPIFRLETRRSTDPLMRHWKMKSFYGFAGQFAPVCGW